MKTAQIEMIGLVLLVTLLLIGGLFYLRFIVLQPEPLATDSTLRTTQVTNLLTALLPLTLCDDKTVRNALAQCATYPDTPFCADRTGCDAIHTSLPPILDATLSRPLGLAYNLTARTPDDAFFSIGPCTTGTAITLPFQEEGKNYELLLRICKNQ